MHTKGDGIIFTAYKSLISIILVFQCLSCAWYFIFIQFPLTILNNCSNLRSCNGLRAACYRPCGLWKGELLYVTVLKLYIVFFWRMVRYLDFPCKFYMSWLYALVIKCIFFPNQSTYCSSLYRHCETSRRTMHIVNLDPAAENFDYPVAMGKFCPPIIARFLGKFDKIIHFCNFRALIFLFSFADIRELISLEDVMEELGLGPNGGLIYCMEYPFCLFFSPH